MKNDSKITPQLQRKMQPKSPRDYSKRQNRNQFLITAKDAAEINSHLLQKSPHDYTNTAAELASAFQSFWPLM